MSKFIRLQATATRLIKENGALYPMRRFTGGVEDKVEGEITGAVEENQDVYMVVLPPSSSVKSMPVLKFMGENGVLVESAVNNCLIAAGGLTYPIGPGYEIQHEGEWKKLTAVTPLKPDGTTVVLYKGFIERV